MDLNDYLDIFIEEAKDHLQSINDELLKLEAEPENIAVVNEIFRSAHTLKGMAGSMSFDDLASLTHEMENVLDLIRNSKLSVTPEIMDVMFQCIDLIERMVESIEQGGTGKENVTNVVTQLKRILNPDLSESSGEVAATAEMVIDDFQTTIINEARSMGNNVYKVKVTLEENCAMKSIRAYMVFQAVEELGVLIQSEPSVEDIEEEKFADFFTLLLLSEQNSTDIQTRLMNISEVKEIIVSEVTEQESQTSAKVEESTKIEQVSQPEVKADPEVGKKKQRSKSIRVDIDKLDLLMNLFSEMVIDRGRLEQIARKTQLNELTETVEHMTRISSDLQDVILNMRMVPVETVFNRFPRMIRDLARDLNKKIQLVIEGEETELDRTVIDEIGDPLVHLLRNALDHGLESTEERIQSNKPEEGKIFLKAYHGGNHVFIEVGDDGKGINREKVLNKAIERGVVSESEAQTLEDQEVYSLILSSGFSTADKISDISGRGVGLDVVKTKIESLGGVISIDSTPGHGSRFLIQLPLTLSIMEAMLVKVGQETYAIPFSSIIEIATVTKDSVVSLQGKQVITFREQILPLVYLSEVFQVTDTISNNDLTELFIVIVRKGDKSIGLVVDTVLGQQEIVLKSLGKLLNNIFAISGATILGDGEVALILDTNQFIK